MGVHHARKKRAKPPKGRPKRHRLKANGEGYDVRVLLMPCPRCGVNPGDQCVRTKRAWSHYRPDEDPQLSNPHPERVELARTA